MAKIILTVNKTEICYQLSKTNKRIGRGLREHLVQTISRGINFLEIGIVGSILVNQIFQLMVRSKTLGNKMLKELQYNKNISSVKTRMNM